MGLGKDCACAIVEMRRISEEINGNVRLYTAARINWQLAWWSGEWGVGSGTRLIITLALQCHGTWQGLCNFWRWITQDFLNSSEWNLKSVALFKKDLFVINKLQITQDDLSKYKNMEDYFKNCVVWVCL